MADEHNGPFAGNVVDEGVCARWLTPIRWVLIDALTVEGTATATRCAQIVGQSQGSCAFQLRQLARFGIVEEAPTTSRRERPWRLTTVRQSWSGGTSEDPAGDRAAQELSQVFVQRETDRIRRWVRDEGAAPAPWRQVALRTPKKHKTFTTPNPHFEQLSANRNRSFYEKAITTAYVRLAHARLSVLHASRNQGVANGWDCKMDA